MPIFADVLHKDFTITVVGAAAGLGGLTLVFLGLVFTAYNALPGPDASVKTRYRRLTVLVGAAFLSSLLSVTTGVVWLADLGGPHGLYVATVALFFVQLALAALAAALVTWKIMWN